MLSRVQYFDHNATSPLSEAARRSWLQAVEAFPGNPSSPHRSGARASKALEDARARLAECLGARAEDLVWTSGATESNNALLHHFAQTREGVAWISAIEHPCVHAAARRWLPGRYRTLPVDAQGRVEPAGLAARQAEWGTPGLVLVMAANNEIGVLQPWREVLAWCREVGARFACDAAQWLGKWPASGLGESDFVSGCAHKFGGPPGVGFLKVPARFQPLLVGGPQEEGRRAGTENVAGGVAAVAALEAREQAIRELNPAEREKWRDAFENQVLRALPGTQVVGANAPRLWNTSALLLPRTDCRRRWVVILDRLGFAVSTGSACSSGQEKPSHVLAALGLDGSGERLLRFSSGWETTAQDWEALGEAMKQAGKEMGIGR